MSFARLVAMLGVALVAAPASARPPEALACAMQAAPEGLEARVADVIVTRDGQRGSQALDELRVLTDHCAEDQFMSAKERGAYFTYIMGRMGRDEIDTRLGALGLRSRVIDQALDIGPDNTNNPADKVTQGDLRLVAEAYGKAGHDPATITAEGWTLITAWIVATAHMFDGLRDLD
jgi:hypothetical protein